MDINHRRGPRRSRAGQWAGHSARLALAGAIGLHGFVAVTAARAQGPAATSGTSADASDAGGTAEDRRDYDIPAGPLDQALIRFGREAGVLLTFPTTTTDGKHSPGLRGRHTVREGLDALLSGSGLKAMPQPNGSYLLGIDAMPVGGTRERERGDTAASLPPVTVRDRILRETATGPVVGWVAQRTATGAKADTALIDIPQSVSVITADELSARAVASVKEAVGYTAGVTPSASFDLREDLTTFRGFPFDWASFYLDGLAMPSTTYGVSTSEPYGMERIEILRGPASMLYGQSSTGGVLNMVSKRPLDIPLREVQVQMGSHDRRQVAFDLTGPIGDSDQWSYRLTGLKRRSNTSIDFVEDNRTYLAPALTWKPSAATSLTLLASLLDDDLGRSGGTSAFLPASGIALPNPNGTIARRTYGGEPSFDYYRKKQYSAGYEFRHQFDDTWQFMQNLRWRKVDLDYQTAYGLGLLASDATRRTLRRGAFGSFGHNEAVSIDSQLQARWQSAGVTHTTLVGLDVKRIALDETRYFGVDGPSLDLFAPTYGAAFALPSDPDTDQSIVTRQVGLYLQDQMRFAQRWLLTLGARWDVASQDINDRLGATRTSLTERKPSGRAGLSYQFDSGIVPYVSAATSFTPTLTPNPYGAPFKALAGRQYELGVKVQPPGSNSLYTAALFDLTQRNGLTADPDQVNHPFGQVQTGEFRSQGLELEARTNLSPSVSVIAAYTYLHARVSRSNDDNVGNAPKGIPRNTASVWTQYKQRGGPLTGLSVGLGVRYVDKRPSADAPGFYWVPSFTMLDAALGYDAGPWQFALSISNLTDKVTYDCWYARCWYGPARQIRATATVRW